MMGKGGSAPDPLVWDPHPDCSACCFLGCHHCSAVALAMPLRFDNLNVVRSIGRLRDRGCLSKPLPVVKDGDLAAIALHMMRARGLDTVRVTKVKEHATDADVDSGRV